MKHLLVLGVFVSFLFVATALVAGAAPLTKVGEMRASVGMMNNHPVFISSVAIPEEVSLPTQVKIAVPQGARMDWVGEVAGGDISLDPTSNYEKVETSNGFDIYLIDVVSHRIAQVEASLTAPYMVSTGENEGQIEFTYIPAVDTEMLLLAAESPPNVLDFDKFAGYEIFATGQSGGMIIGQSFEEAKAGEEYSVAYGFTTQDAAAAAARNTSTGDTLKAILIVLGLILAVIIGSLAVIVRRQKTQGGAPNAAGRSAHPPRALTTGKKAPAKSNVSRTPKKSSGAMKWNSPQLLMVILVAVVAIGLLAWTSSRNANTITENNGIYSQIFATGEPCANVVFTLTDEAMKNPGATAKELFRYIRDSDVYILGATLDANQGTVVVDYCASNLDEYTIVDFLGQTKWVSGNNVPAQKALGTPVTMDDGTIALFFAQHPPCEMIEFTLESPGVDTVALIKQLASAVKGVPSVTGVAFDPATGVASLGFCIDQASVDDFADALEKAGIAAKQTGEMVQVAPGSVLY